MYSENFERREEPLGMIVWRVILRLKAACSLAVTSRSKWLVWMTEIYTVIATSVVPPIDFYCHTFAAMQV